MSDTHPQYDNLLLAGAIVAKPPPVEETTIPKNPLGLEDMLDTLNELRLEDEHDGYGLLRPTNYAVEMVEELLVETEAQEGWIPYGGVFPDGKGGLQVEWDWHGRQVHLGVPSQPSGRLYIYYSDGSKGQIEKEVSGLTLAHLTIASRVPVHATLSS